MSDGGRLKIWRWSGRDVVSLYDLDLVAAVPSRRELHRLTVRLRLPKTRPGWLWRVKPHSVEGDLALARPGTLIWRDVDGSAEPGGGWRPEEELDEVRRRSTTRTAIPGGRVVIPLHRPDADPSG